MTSFQFKGIKMLTVEQHEELLKNGQYTLEDGTIVPLDKNYFYASKDSVDLEKLMDAIGVNTENITNINNSLSNYQLKEDDTLTTESKNIVEAINEINAKEDKAGLNKEEVIVVIDEQTQDLKNQLVDLATIQELMKDGESIEMVCYPHYKQSDTEYILDTIPVKGQNKIGIDWGDGSFTIYAFTNDVFTNFTHTYSEQKDYTIKFYNVDDIAGTSLSEGAMNYHINTIKELHIKQKISDIPYSFILEQLSLKKIVCNQCITHVSSGIVNGCGKYTLYFNGQTPPVFENGPFTYIEPWFGTEDYFYPAYIIVPREALEQYQNIEQLANIKDRITTEAYLSDIMTKEEIQVALDDKYDIIPEVHYAGCIPCTTKDKETKEIVVSTAIMASQLVPETIAYRDEYGRTKVEGPVDDYDAANKGYVDAKIDNANKKYRHRIQLNVSLANSDQTISEYQISGCLVSNRASPYTTESFLNDVVHTTGHPTLIVITGHNINDASIRIIGGYYVADGSAQLVTFYLWNSNSQEIAIVEGTPLKTEIKTSYAPVEF